MRSKKQKLIEFNKANILGAARRLYAANGTARTTVDEIAKEADCSKATIYVYFQNKEDIYYHIVLEYMIALRDSAVQCFSSSRDYEKAYFALCNTLVRLQREQPMYFECILGKISVEQEKMNELPVLKSIFDIGEEINRIVCGFLQRAQQDGFVKSELDPLQTTFVMWSAIGGLISINSNKTNYLESRLKISQEEFLENGFTMLLCMIRNGGK